MKLTCESRTEDVVALFTSACGISSMSESLAEKLGVAQGRAERILNVGAEYYGHLPDRVVYVECDIHRASEGSGVIRAPVAFLIMPNPYNELVLGRDWFDELGRQEPNLALVMGAGEDSPGRTYMRLDFGTPTRGPGFTPGVMSIGHIIQIGKNGIDDLKGLVQEENQRCEEALLLTTR